MRGIKSIISKLKNIAFFKKISFGFVISILSVGIQGLAGLAIIPILLKFLSEGIVGLWILFTSFTNLILLGQAGLSTVVTRYSAIIKSKSITNYEFWGISRTLYLMAVLFVFIICFVTYFIFISPTLREEDFVFEGTVCWIFFSASFLIQVYSSKYIHIINGFGEVGWDKLIRLITALLNLFGFFAALEIGLSFKFLGVVFFVTSLVGAFSSYFLYNKFDTGLIKRVKSKVQLQNITVYLKESFKILVLNVTSYLILQANFIIIKHFSGLEILPYYGGLFRVTSLIMAITGIVTTIFFPFITQTYTNGEIGRLKGLIKVNVVLCGSVSVVLSFILLLVGDWLVPVWLGEGGYLGNTVFGIMLIMTIIYSVVTAFAQTIIAIGANTFVEVAIIQGFLSVSLSYFIGSYYGLTGILIGNLVGTIIPGVYIVFWSVIYLKKI